MARTLKPFFISPVAPVVSWLFAGISGIPSAAVITSVPPGTPMTEAPLKAASSVPPSSRTRLSFRSLPFILEANVFILYQDPSVPEALVPWRLEIPPWVRVRVIKRSGPGLNGC